MSTMPVEAVLPSGRLRVPHHKGDKYILDYRAGWNTSMRGAGENSPWNQGTSSDAFDDGYLDAASREDEKWHLAWCTAHGNQEGECGRA